jgi:hypothetical protein
MGIRCTLFVLTEFTLSFGKICKGVYVKLIQIKEIFLVWVNDIYKLQVVLLNTEVSHLLAHDSN